MAELDGMGSDAFRLGMDAFMLRRVRDERMLDCLIDRAATNEVFYESHNV